MAGNSLTRIKPRNIRTGSQNGQSYRRREAKRCQGRRWTSWVAPEKPVRSDGQKGEREGEVERVDRVRREVEVTDGRRQLAARDRGRDLAGPLKGEEDEDHDEEATGCVPWRADPSRAIERRLVEPEDGEHE